MRYWTPPIVWTAIILIASSDLFSAARTGGLLHFALGLLGWTAEDEILTAIHFILRKSVHLIAYGILGALWFRALRSGRGGWRMRWAGWAVALALIVAAIDESLQSRSKLRTGSLADVAIDGVGAAGAQGIVRRRVRLPAP